jgi:hypothetical protein
MVDRELEEFRRFSYMESRIPRLDALEVFVPSGAENDETLNEVRNRTGFSRWLPVDGGHRVLILYEGGEYDPNRFSLIRGGWDHEHCTRCSCRIEPMTLCWVTREGPYIVLCHECHLAVDSDTDAIA